MGRSKGADEVFCTACGARIKRAAEHCPHCGVPNEQYDPAAATDSTPNSTAGSAASTTVSDSGPAFESGPASDSGPASESTETVGRADTRPGLDQRSPSEVQATRDADAAPAGAATAGSSSAAGATHGSSDADADAATWWYGVAAAGLTWVVVLVAWATGSQHGALVLLALLAWVGLPIALVRDAAFVRDRSAWQPSSGPWAFAALVPILNVVAAVVYLTRRHEVLGTP